MKPETTLEGIMRKFGALVPAGVMLIGTVFAAEVWLKDDDLVAKVEKKKK